jgi:uncharacterized protein (DUF488 family)
MYPRPARAGSWKPPSTLALAADQRAWDVERLDRLVALGRPRFDFVTAGSSGKEPKELLRLLRRPVFAVRQLIDIRANPNSPHTPLWDRAPLERTVLRAGLTYLARPDLGVPRELRSQRKNGAMADAELFRWYDRNVATREAVRALGSALAEPSVLLCTELGPSFCHRHRLALALEKAFDWVSYDL